MTKEEFLQEALRSPFAPPDFKEMFALQEKYQGIAVSILKAFDRVCRQNKIDYQLAFGSLLGVIRDGGIIPWDYDIDVFVHARDRQALIEALELYLEPPFYYDVLENNPRRQGVIMRIGKMPFSTLHLHVDVFFLAGTPDDERESKKFCKRLRRASAVISVKNTPLFEINPFVSPRGWLEIAVGKILFLFKNKNKAFELYLKSAEAYDSRTSKRLINANSYGGTYYLTSLYYQELTEYKSDIGSFMIPLRYKEVLTELFGDYTGVPDLKSRIRETAEHYREFLELEKIRVSEISEKL